jgi:hypothetical protein
VGCSFTRRRACDQLTADATAPAPNGYLVTLGCSCGVVFMRWVTPEETGRDLMASDLRVAAR